MNIKIKSYQKIKTNISVQFLCRKVFVGIYCVVCLNCLFILVHTFVGKGKERELWWVKFSFPSGTWIQESDSHKHDRELTLAAPWWARCAAPSPGRPPSEPPRAPPTLAGSSLPPRCQPGGEGTLRWSFFFFRFAGTLDLELVVSIYHWTEFVLTSSNCWNAQKFQSSEFTWFASQI